MNYLTDAMAWVLHGLQGATGSYGLAVIGLTVLVRLVLTPLGLAQFRAMQVQKRLQPKLQELQKKYKEKPQELQRRMMELYREHRVNPLGGCLPSLVQLPVLIGLFNALRELPAGAGFLVWDLSIRDPYFVLPILAGITTYLSMKPTMDPSQQNMMIIMSAVTVAFGLTFPSGLLLYWLVNNLFSMVQQWVFQRQLAVAEGGAKAG